MRTLVTPKGYNEMIKMFGDIHPYVNEDGTLDVDWEGKILDSFNLPYPLQLSWNGQLVTRMRCHFLLTSIIEELFKKILIEGLENECREFGGCYSYRAQRGAKKLSTHAWGIAIDVEPTKNPLGGPVNINPRIVEIFEYFGFIWGGNFRRVDGQHFQFVGGY